MNETEVFMIAALTCLLRGDSPNVALGNAEAFLDLMPTWVAKEMENTSNGID